MCKFFSFISDGSGRPFYFDSVARQKIRMGEGRYKDLNPDSHTSIATFYGYTGEKEDSCNKYEYNPITLTLVKDQINTIDDSKEIEQFCKSLDFKTIIPQANFHTIVNALKIERKKKTPSKEEIQLLKKWASVRASVVDSVWDSVVDSVGGSVWDDVSAQIGSLFILPEWKYVQVENGEYPFQACVDLWNAGLVPSFDGTTWRLHAGENAEIVYEMKASEK